MWGVGVRAAFIDLAHVCHWLSLSARLYHSHLALASLRGLSGHVFVLVLRSRLCRNDGEKLDAKTSISNSSVGAQIPAAVGLHSFLRLTFQASMRSARAVAI